MESCTTWSVVSGFFNLTGFLRFCVVTYVLVFFSSQVIFHYVDGIFCLIFTLVILLLSMFLSSCIHFPTQLLCYSFLIFQCIFIYLKEQHGARDLPCTDLFITRFPEQPGCGSVLSRGEQGASQTAR